MKLRFVSVLLIFPALLLSGCWHMCRRPPNPCGPSGCPPQDRYLGPGRPMPPGPPPGPPPGSPDQSGLFGAGTPESPWRPSPGPPPRLGPPEGNGNGNNVRLYPPESSGAPDARTRPESPLLPVGIPQFAIAKDKVASGLKPFPDGLEWLKGNGYRTVLHVRRPGEDDAAAKRMVEKAGLTYLTLEVAPATLNQTLLEEFNRLVDDARLLPLFVYDKDGMLAGGLWYLHFRFVEQAGDEEARLRAARLGLKPDTDESHKDMWLAIQKLLSEKKP